MKKTEYKTYLFELFDAPVDGVSYEERMALIERYLVEYQIKHDKQRDQPNRGDPWTDEELRVVLMDAPTKSNCIKYAKVLVGDMAVSSKYTAGLLLMTRQ